MHTPGPWYLAAQRGESIAIADPLCRPGKGGYLAVVPAWLPLEERMNNALLIAAAPAMLRALQRLAHPAADDDDLAYAQSVIRAATGAT
jgi:hypothetical protein